MGKAERFLQEAGPHIRESMGAGRTPTIPRAAAGPDPDAELGHARGAAEIPLGRIDRDPAQPREEFDPDALERLAESIRGRGLLQPIRVRWNESAGRYILVCGERRWRAAQMAGLATATAVIHEGSAAPEEWLALQLVENCLREDLRPIEQARAYRALMDARGWTATDLARELSITHAAISRALAILGTPAAVQDLVETGALSPTAAYEVSKVADPREQAELAQQAAAEGWTIRQISEAARAVVPARKPRGTVRATRATRTWETPHGEFRFRANGAELSEADLRAAVRDLARQVNGRSRGAA